MSITGGEPYQRGRALTILVAWLFRALGESAFVARLPALLFSGLAVALLYLWVRAHGERLAALVAALLLALDPESVKLSTMMRFYTAQLLFFLIGVIAVEALVEWRRRALATVALAAAAAASLVFAYELQMVTAIGIGGLGLYVALIVGPPLLVRARTS